MSGEDFSQLNDIPYTQNNQHPVSSNVFDNIFPDSQQEPQPVAEKESSWGFLTKLLAITFIFVVVCNPLVTGMMGIESDETWMMFGGKVAAIAVAVAVVEWLM